MGSQLWIMKKKKYKAIAQEIWQNINFVPNVVQRILWSHKISEKYNEQEMFYKKCVQSKKRVTSYKLPVQIHKLQVQIHESRVQFHELRAQVYKLRVQIYKLRVQIHELED